MEEWENLCFRLAFAGGIVYNLPCMEGYRSGHNGAVLKTVRAKAHAGSNPAPSAIKETSFVYRERFVKEKFIP